MLLEIHHLKDSSGSNRFIRCTPLNTIESISDYLVVDQNKLSLWTQDVNWTFSCESTSHVRSIYVQCEGESFFLWFLENSFSLIYDGAKIWNQFFFDFFSELSLAKSKIKQFFKKVTANEVISIIDVVFLLWLNCSNDFVCEFQNLLVILIFRTFRNYIYKKILERWPSSLTWSIFGVSSSTAGT